jgi:ATP synthase protein I
MIVDSSDILRTQQNFQVLAAPPPSVSFRTKQSNSSQQIAPQVSVWEEDFASPQNDYLVGMPDSPETYQSPSEDSSMSDFYNLRFELLISTCLFSVVLFVLTCFLFDLNIALNYLLGAFAGLAYLGLLARNVERLGTSQQVGKSQLAVFVGVIVLAAQIDGLLILPVFLGFCTYKLAILVYTLRAAVLNP